MLYVLLTAVAVLGLSLEAISRRVERLPVTEPLAALLAGVVLGPELLGVLDVPALTAATPEFHQASQVLLAVSVMGVALRYPSRALRRITRPTLILLTVGLLGMAALTTVLAALLLGAAFTGALLLGTALSPTDPVLASSVLTGRAAEETLPARDRQLLSIESGANDGLALPLVLVAVGLASDEVGVLSLEAAYAVLGGVVLGALTGWVVGRGFRSSEQHGEVGQGPALIFTVVLALGTLGASALLRLDGVLAVFVAGLLFNRTSSGRERGMEAPVDEGINKFLVLPLFLALGAALPWSQWGDLGWVGPALALAVLLLRRLPVVALLRRPLGLSWPEAAYAGWFGPIGVSAVFYLTLEAERDVLGDRLLAAGLLVVVASTLVHGVSTAPGLTGYARATRTSGRSSG